MGWNASGRCGVPFGTALESGLADLRAVGVSAGDLIIVAPGDPMQTAAAVFACWRLGAVPAAVAPAEQGQFIRQAKRARARFLWTATGLAELEGSEKLRNAAYVQFSSGTTRDPAAVALSADAIVRFTASYARRLACTGHDVMVHWLPLNHDFGLFQGLVLPALLGCKACVLSPRQVMMRPAIFFRAVHELRGSVTAITNSAFRILERVRDEDMNGLDLSCLRVIGCGGEPIQELDAARFVKRFERCGMNAGALTPGYGLAEATMCVSACAPGSPLQVDWVEGRSLRKMAIPCPAEWPRAVGIVSNGRPLDGNEAAIIDESGARLGQREVGEIILRGPTLMNGYLSGSATAAVIRDGWLHTGDLGYMLNGELYPCERKKDLILVGGRSVSPTLIEALALEELGGHSRRVLAFGLLDPVLGTEVAVLVCGVKSDLNPEVWRGCVAAIQGRAAKELGLSLFDIRAVPPKWIEVSSSGKLARARTREKYIAGFQPKPAGSDAGVLAIARRELGMPHIGPDTDLVDAGADSLSLLRLVIAVESTCGVQLEADVWMESPTVEALERLLSGSKLAPAARPAKANGQRPGIRERFDNLARHGPVIRNRAVPYRWGVPLHRRWMTLGWVRRSYFSKELGQIAEALPSVGPETRNQILAALGWYPWRLRALSDPAALSRWSKITGGEYIGKELASGKGVILAQAHSNVQWLAEKLPWCLKRPVVSIGNVAGGADFARRQRELGRPVDLRGRVAQMAAARRALAANGLVWIGPDLSQGTGGIVIPFQGRWKTFRPGMAELSLQSSARVLPVFSGVRKDGVVYFEFLPPLEWPPEDLGHDERVSHLLRQYAAILEHKWATDPASLDIDSIQEFLRSPKV